MNTYSIYTKFKTMYHKVNLSNYGKQEFGWKGKNMIATIRSASVAQHSQEIHIVSILEMIPMILSEATN